MSVKEKFLDYVSYDTQSDSSSTTMPSTMKQKLLAQHLYSVADAMVLGRGVGVNALAAAGSTGSVHFFIFGFINGLTHGYLLCL